MISDVPLGGFLSSGTDSFAIIRAMEQVNSGQTRAYSVGFTNKDFNELPWTRQAAEALGVSLESQMMELDFQELCDLVRPYCRDPFADSSSLPTYLLCGMASQHVKVALTGDGGDELLAGYATHRAGGPARRYRRLPAWLRKGVIKPLTLCLPEIGGKYSLREKAGRFVMGAENDQFRRHAAWRTVFDRRLKRKIYTEDFWRQTKDFDTLEMYAEPLRRAHQAGCDELDCMLYADLSFYLPNDMLVKVDRMSMAHGLEVRVPFLDAELVEFCWRLPAEMKLRGKTGKYVLRRAIADRYPQELARRPKSGFNMAYDRRAETAIDVDNRFCKPATLRYRDGFGHYHQLMMRFLFEMLPK